MRAMARVLVMAVSFCLPGVGGVRSSSRVL
jgi:hypothetical protein